MAEDVVSTLWQLTASLWVFSDETLAAMLAEAEAVANDDTLVEADELQSRAEAKTIADLIRPVYLDRHSDYQLNADGTITPERSGTA